MKIAAFDLSLTCTGYARSNGAHWEVGNLANKLRGCERLQYLRDRVLRLAACADLVVIEGYAYASGQGAHQLGELGGVIRLALYEARLPVVELPPATLKRYATGTGNAKKDQVLAAAIRRLGYEGHINDEADALWLLHAALDHYGQPLAVTLPAAQREALAKVVWPELARAVHGAPSAAEVSA